MYYCVAKMDPGYVKKDDTTSFQDLIETYKDEPLLLCPECEIRRPPRSIHCVECNRCTDVYDHHCPWLNNCIGKNNQSCFMMFLTLLFWTMIQSLGSAIYVCAKKSHESSVHVDWIPDDIEPLFKNEYVFWILNSVVFIMALIYIYPVVTLFRDQCWNIKLGKTSHERWGTPQYHHDYQEDDNNLKM